MNVPSVASTSTADDDATEVIEARVIDTSESMLRLASSLVRDVAALCSRRSGSEGISSIPCPKAQHHAEYQPMRETPGKQTSADEMEPQDNLAPTPHSPIGMEPSPEATHSEPMALQSHAEASLPPQVIIKEARECDRVGGSGNQAIKPSSIKRFKQTYKRIVKRPPTCKSPFVTQCVKQFPKIPHAHRVVADYALAEIGDPSEILCEMYEMYITREEISCLNVGRWVNSVVSYLSLSNNSFMIMQMFIPVCENNHWHMHVVNFAAGRVEILSSLPLRRGNSISAATRRLSMAINKALHAYIIHMNVDVSTFEHVQPHLVQQLNGFDCGILALKFMEFWNGATLTTSVAEDKLNMYRLQLVVELVLNERNTVKDKIMASCHL
ncbi:unnamed protein product, partial [Vitis vinifera]